MGPIRSHAVNKSDLVFEICRSAIVEYDEFVVRDEEDAVIRPLPRIKRLLSEPACLAHVVQLLLTFDPILVEKVIMPPASSCFMAQDY